MKKIYFNALNKFQYNLSIILIIISMLLTIAIFMLIVIYYSINNLSRSELIAILGISGVILFLTLAVLIKKIFSSAYELSFEENGIAILQKNKKQFLEYSNCEKITVWNNTDYSRIIFHTHNEQIGLYIGFANLLQNSQTILNKNDELYNILLKNNFAVQIKIVKQIEIIEYKR